MTTTNETFTGTTRPSSLDDLTDWDRRGDYIATIHSEHLVKFPSLGQHLLSALAEAQRLGLTVTKDGEIVLERTTEELEEKLATKQRTWDNNKDVYHRALAGDPVYAWQHGQIDAWAQAEGLDPINWDEVPVR